MFGMASMSIIPFLGKSFLNLLTNHVVVVVV